MMLAYPYTFGNDQHIAEGYPWASKPPTTTASWKQIVSTHTSEGLVADASRRYQYYYYCCRLLWRLRYRSVHMLRNESFKQLNKYAHIPAQHAHGPPPQAQAAVAADTIHYDGDRPSSSERPPKTGPLSSLSLSLPRTCASRTDLDLSLASAYHIQRTIHHISHGDAMRWHGVIP